MDIPSEYLKKLNLSETLVVARFGSLYYLTSLDYDDNLTRSIPETIERKTCMERLVHL